VDITEKRLRRRAKKRRPYKLGRIRKDHCIRVSPTAAKVTRVSTVVGVTNPGIQGKRGFIQESVDGRTFNEPVIDGDNIRRRGYRSENDLTPKTIHGSRCHRGSIDSDGHIGRFRSNFPVIFRDEVPSIREPIRNGQGC